MQLAVIIGSEVMSLTTGIFMISGLIAFHGTGLVDSGTGECSRQCSRCDVDQCKECYYGHWGHNCQREYVNCWLGGCKKDSGRCEQCTPGRHGSHCKSQCPVKCRPSKSEDVAHCHRHTGKCLDGCQIGWWGSTCQHRCSAGCNQSCYEEDGACISDCRKGYYGTHCNKSCSEECTSGTCDWWTGICHGGCKCGYAGKNCKDVCSINCKTMCWRDAASNCLKCPQCKHGFFGQDCDFECSTFCTNKNCDMSGYCTEGCNEGYYGNRCNNTCSINCRECNRSLGVCTSRDDESSTIQRPSTGYIVSSNEEDTPTNAADHTIERSGIIQRLILPALALHIMQS